LVQIFKTRNICIRNVVLHFPDQRSDLIHYELFCFCILKEDIIENLINRRSLNLVSLGHPLDQVQGF
jgi:hypothetical protein